MRDLSPLMEARISAGATTLARCWRIIRRDGIALGFTEHDSPLSFDGTEFEPESAAEGGTIEMSSGLSADSHEIAGALTSARISEADLRRGHYDGAEVETWIVDWQMPEARLLLSRGILSEIRERGGSFSAEIVGLAERLNRPIGRAYLPTCPLRVGEAACGVDLDLPAHRGTGIVVATVDAGRFFVSGLDGFESGWFSGGRASWASGALAGLGFDIGAHEVRGGGTLLTLWQALPEQPALGDTVEVTAGCDKTPGTCRAKFANFLNFRGFPLMPGDDWVAGYVDAGGPHDGGSLFGR